MLFAPFRRLGRGNAFSKYLAGECDSFPSTSTPLNFPGFRIYKLHFPSFQLTILPPDDFPCFKILPFLVSLKFVLFRRPISRSAIFLFLKFFLSGYYPITMDRESLVYLAKLAEQVRCRAAFVLPEQCLGMREAKKEIGPAWKPLIDYCVHLDRQLPPC